MADVLRYDMGNVRGGPLLCYDAAQVEDDVLMLSGPHGGTGGSTPPGSWPNPGDNDVWDGPYGPKIVDWTDVSHPGFDARWPPGGGSHYSPPNRSWHWDASVPAGYYTRITKQNRYDDREEIPSVS